MKPSPSHFHKTHEELTNRKILTMLTASLTLNVLLLFIVTWGINDYQHRREAAKRSARRNKDLNKPGLLRSQTSSSSSGLKDADRKRLILVVDENARLKGHCKKQIEAIESLEKTIRAAKSQLAWFNEWYPKLRSAHEALAKRVDKDMKEWKNYGRDSRKAFERLSQRHEDVKKKARRWFDAVEEYKAETNDSKQKFRGSQGLLQAAESEIRRLKTNQKHWKQRTEQLEASINELTADIQHVENEKKDWAWEKEDLEARDEDLSGGVPFERPESRAEMRDEIDYGAYDGHFEEASRRAKPEAPSDIRSARLPTIIEVPEICELQDAESDGGNESLSELGSATGSPPAFGFFSDM